MALIGIGSEPGYVSTKLHRSLDPNAKFSFVYIAEWESMDAFLAALNNEEIKSVGEGFPTEMPHYPAPYEVIRT
ncbi:MAG: antibiotic biosynthesis monooxygenase [Rhodothermaceae bacterium]|nr:antibiotic biosynthesis monooxygenase [Rhodothermaceae bacterium]